MQYDAQEDGTFQPLKRKNIDTGMGLERTAAVLQGVGSDFEIDLFKPIVEAIEEAASRSLAQEDLPNRNLVADHIRGVVFLIADGVLPGNEKQGYVLRRILRSAIRASEKLELPPGSLKDLVEPVVETLGETYPEIVSARSLAERVISREEETFSKTLRSGERRLQEILEDLIARGKKTLPGEIAFELYDTYGFPLEMTEGIAAPAGAKVDVTGYQEAMSLQRKRSRQGVVLDFTEGFAIRDESATSCSTLFVGYDTLKTEAEIIEYHPKDGGPEYLVFDQTPFFAEAGGQVADTGSIENLTQGGVVQVVDAKKDPSGITRHLIQPTEQTFRINIGDRCCLIVDETRRKRIAPIIRQHTSFTKRYVRCWENTWFRQVPWSRMRSCGLTSPILRK